MKTARFLLACALVSVLAACGSQGITAPDTARPPRPAHDDGVGGGDDPTIGEIGGSGETHCVPVIVINPDGTTSTVCQTNNNAGGMLGTGG